jgi:hypothetical protein
VRAGPHTFDRLLHLEVPRFRGLVERSDSLARLAHGPLIIRRGEQLHDAFVRLRDIVGDGRDGHTGHCQEAPEIRIENDDGNQAISISQSVSLETRLLIFVIAI